MTSVNVLILIKLSCSFKMLSSLLYRCYDNKKKQHQQQNTHLKLLSYEANPIYTNSDDLLTRHAPIFHHSHIQKLKVNHFQIIYPNVFLLQKLLLLYNHPLSFFLEYFNQLNLHDSILRSALTFPYTQNPMYKHIRHQ